MITVTIYILLAFAACFSLFSLAVFAASMAVYNAGSKENQRKRDTELVRHVLQLLKNKQSK